MFFFVGRGGGQRGVQCVSKISSLGMTAWHHFNGMFCDAQQLLSRQNFQSARHTI